MCEEAVSGVGLRGASVGLVGGLLHLHAAQPASPCFCTSSEPTTQMKGGGGGVRHAPTPAAPTHN